jgi:hypothetical protein
LKFLGYDDKPSLSGSNANEETRSDVHGRIRSPKARAGRPRTTQYTLVSGPGGWDPLSLEQLRRALELSLQSEKYVSPRKIAKQLGHPSPDRILRKFPNLCAALNARRTSEATAREAQIRDRLRRALLEWPPPTLKSIATQLRVSSSTPLRSIDDGLCEQILERGEEWKQEELKGIRSLLQREIRAKGKVPLAELCRRHEISLSLVISQLPDLKRRYEQQYIRSKSAQRSQRYEKFRREVKKAVVMLIERGDFPSAGRVLLLNPSLGYAGWDRMQHAIRGAIESTKSQQQL